jgi:hypothetical protein
MGSDLSSHSASTGTVAMPESDHIGLSSTSHGLSSGLATSATPTDVTTDHPTTDHTALVHH